MPRRRARSRALIRIRLRSTALLEIWSVKALLLSPPPTSLTLRILAMLLGGWCLSWIKNFEGVLGYCRSFAE